MTGFRSDCSTNWATTTAHVEYVLMLTKVAGVKFNPTISKEETVLKNRPSTFFSLKHLVVSKQDILNESGNGTSGYRVAVPGFTRFAKQSKCPEIF